MKSQHSVQRYAVADRQRVVVDPGQWLTSHRRLRRDAGYRSPKGLVRDLHELLKVGVISASPIIRQRFQNGNASVSESETGRFQNGNAGTTLATLITVHGVNDLAEGGVSKLETKEIRARGRVVLSPADREWQRADAQLAAEGR
jgi:hypothetical protein